MIERTLDDLKRIRKLEIETKKLVKDLFSGAWASCYKGNGIEPEDLRAYANLDPIRFIDWHVTARAGKPYIRLFREERQLTVMLLVDISGSTNFGDKRNKMAEMAALIAFSALKNGDRVGLMLFSSIIEKYISPKQGSNHILPLIQDLLYFKASRKKTDVKAALEGVNRLQKKRCAIFLFSDFLYSLDPQLIQIMCNRHDLVAIDLNDPLENTFDKLGWLRMQDMEKGNRILIDTANEDFQEHYPEMTAEIHASNKKSVERAGGTFISLSSTDSVKDKLIEFFSHKRKR